MRFPTHSLCPHREYTFPVPQLSQGIHIPCAPTGNTHSLCPSCTPCDFQTQLLYSLWSSNHLSEPCEVAQYGAATTRRLLKITGLFCNRDLEKRRYSAKEPYNFKEPTTCSRPIPITKAINRRGKGATETQPSSIRHRIVIRKYGVKPINSLVISTRLVEMQIETSMSSLRFDIRMQVAFDIVIRKYGVKPIWC